MFFRSYAESPTGRLSLLASDTHLQALIWENSQLKRLSWPEGVVDQENSILKETKLQLKEYFAGQRKFFELPLQFIGTAFQKSVWNELTKIPYGETRSYSAIANLVGSPKAVRAVGMTNGKNPIAIIVPCHRVVGKNGALTGFSGGIQNKEFLLNLEQGSEAVPNRNKLSEPQNIKRFSEQI